ncbi:MAG: antitermination protein NusG [Planctomycetaceae bacterium]|nr:MAG: antitermination protein NusG [Planctomycetaceae bacterium]
MPILAREPDVFPADLLESPPAARDPERNWLVAYTISRREKELARRLLACGLPFFLPQREQQFRSPSGRRQKAFLPMFPGYVFVLAEPGERELILKTNCISQLLNVTDPDELEFDLRQIFQLTRAGTTLTLEPKLEPGTRVRIVSGAFQGFEGTVLKRQAGDRLLVMVRYVQQGVSFSLEGFQVEPL